MVLILQDREEADIIVDPGSELTTSYRRDTEDKDSMRMLFRNKREREPF